MPVISLCLSEPLNHSKIIAWRNVVSDKLALKVRSLVNKSTQVYEAGDLIYTLILHYFQCKLCIESSKIVE